MRLISFIIQIKFKDINQNQYVNLNQEWNSSNGYDLMAQVIMETCKTA